MHRSKKLIQRAPRGLAGRVRVHALKFRAQYRRDGKSILRSGPGGLVLLVFGHRRNAPGMFERRRIIEAAGKPSVSGMIRARTAAITLSRYRKIHFNGAGFL